jgi:hypothetical protein
MLFDIYVLKSVMEEFQVIINIHKDGSPSGIIFICSNDIKKSIEKFLLLIFQSEMTCARITAGRKTTKIELESDDEMKIALLQQILHEINFEGVNPN